MTREHTFELTDEMFQRLRRYQLRLQREMPGVEVTPSLALRLLLGRVTREAGLGRPAPRRELA